MKICPSCNNKIPGNYIGANKDITKLRCPKCKKILTLTKKSSIIYMIVTLVPIILGVLLIKNMTIEVILMLIWVVASLNFIRPAIYKYEVPKK